jgi:hypothetical protein
MSLADVCGLIPDDQKPSFCSAQPACSLAGTWSGWADRNWNLARSPGLAWLATQTAASSGKSGDMVVNWVPSSGDIVPDNMHMTPGHGVWELDTSDLQYPQYKFTWYAYVVSDIDVPEFSFVNGATAFSVLARGFVSFPTQDCDHASIGYVFEMIQGMVSPDKLSEKISQIVAEKESNPDSTLFYYGTSGGGGETKVPMAQLVF